MPPKVTSALDNLAAARANAIGRLLLLARKNFVRQTSDGLKARGHGEIPAKLLTLLPYLTSEGTRNSELVELAGISKQAVGKIVNDIEKIGLLAREPDESDGRAWRVRLTAKGLRLLIELHRVVAEVEQQYEARLGSKRMADLRAALQTIASDQGVAPGNPGLAAKRVGRTRKGINRG